MWLTPCIDWRPEYTRWPAPRKLEYVDRVMREIADAEVVAPEPTDDDLPVEAMHYPLAAHYESEHEVIPIRDERQFDADLRHIVMPVSEAPHGEPASDFLRRHYREIVSRVSFWTSEQPSVVRSLLDTLVRRSDVTRLRAGALEASTLTEVTAFATAVVMLFRTTQVPARARDAHARSA